jgi:hypothetical protein
MLPLVIYRDLMFAGLDYKAPSSMFQLKLRERGGVTDWHTAS